MLAVAQLGVAICTVDLRTLGPHTPVLLVDMGRANLPFFAGTACAAHTSAALEPVIVVVIGPNNTTIATATIATAQGLAVSAGGAVLIIVTAATVLSLTGCALE
jgi:hypothetical protein